MSHSRKKALFLDRDGVININYGYVYQAQNVTFVDGIFDLICRFIEQDYLPIIVTNQSGIARGLYDELAFEAVMKHFQQAFTQHGIGAVPVFYCPHHPDFPDHSGVTECRCRKPQPGMFEQAVAAHGIAVDDSVMIGDKVIDMIAAERAGVTRRILFDANGEQREKLSSDSELKSPQHVEVFDRMEDINP